MERSIRIGKDFNVRWSIHGVEDGERQPYELAGKELVLQYRTPYGLKEATEWKVVGNTIVWTFRGKEQKALGSYELILTENGGKDGMVTVDTCRAFKLVAHSCEETEGSGSDIVIEDVVLESEVAFAALRGPQGEQGPAGPQGPQGERGPEGPQGPAGPSYNDTEIKGKLAELSAEIKRPNVEIDDLENGYFNTFSTTLPPIRNTLEGGVSAKFSVNPNEVYEIYGTASMLNEYYRLYALYDADGNRIGRCELAGNYRETPFVVTIPSGATTMVVNLISYNVVTDRIVKIGEKYDFAELDKIPQLQNGIDALHINLDSTKEDLEDLATQVLGVKPAAINAGYLNSDTTIYGGEGYAHYAIPIQPNDVIEIKAKKTILTQYAVASAYNLEGKTYVSSSFIQGRQTIAAGTTYSFVAPADAKWLLINKTINKGDYTPDIINVNGHNVKEGEPSSVGITPSFVKYTASKNEFEVFMWNGEYYYSAVVALNADEAYCQKVWRIARGSKYTKSREKLCNIIDTGENEFVLQSADFHGNGGHTGGVHGGELVDGDTDCFVKFFVDGILVLDLTKDFEKECTTFEYVELTTLNKVIDSEGNPIVGTPIFAKHLKNTKFEGCGISVRNIVSFTDAVTINQYFAGLFCVSKDSATKAILPFAKLMDMVGDSSTYEATDKDDSTIIMWDEGNEVKVTISSEYVRGIDFSTTGLKQYENIWDRSIDTKYYRYCLGNLDYKNGDIVETKTHIQFD